MLSTLLPFLLAVAGAPPHPGPPLNLQVEVQDGAVLVQLLGEQKLLNGLFGLDSERRLVDPVSAADLELVKAGALDRLGSSMTLTVDGEVIEPVLSSVKFFQAGLDNYEPSLQVELRFPCLGTPDEVVFDWTLFPTDDFIPGVIRNGVQFEWFQLTPADPGFTWYPREVVLEAGALVRPAAAPGERGRGGRLWPAALALGLGLVIAFLLRPLGARLAAGTLGIASAALLVAWGSAQPAGFRLPTEDEAIELFEGLHRAIYASLSARSEDELYAILASAVDKDVMDELYSELRESMVLRREGGAWCQVRSVEPLGSELTLSDEPAASEEDLAFEVEWKWRVEGDVTHYGHTHTRTNVYRALYQVAHDGEGWKIQGWEVLEHSRADDQDRLRTLIGPEGDD
jgi:hypothetical protein